jgi:alpha-tubulin suppressor-like RCC1 family protein
MNLNSMPQASSDTNLHDQLRAQAVSLFNQGKHAEAEELLEAVLAAQLGLPHPDTLTRAQSLEPRMHVHARAAQQTAKAGKATAQRNERAATPPPTALAELEAELRVLEREGASNVRMSVFAWGWNKDGQCGYFGEKILVPTAVPLSDVAAVASSPFHTVFVRCDQTVFVCGREAHLGLTDAEVEAAATRSVADGICIRNPYLRTGVSFVACGAYHTMAMDVEGQLWGWGDNSCGQLALPATAEMAPAPVRIAGLPHVMTVACGFRFTAVVADTHMRKLFTFGCNRFGQLGLNTSAATVRDPARVVLADSKPLPPVQQVSCGDYHMLVLLQGSGGVLACGNLTYGRCGVCDVAEESAEGTRCTRALQHVVEFDRLGVCVAKLCAGGASSAAITAHGAELFTWGCNTRGQLGLGHLESVTVPTRVRSFNGPVIDVGIGSDHLVVLGSAEDEQPRVFTCGFCMSGRLGRETADGVEGNCCEFLPLHWSPPSAYGAVAVVVSGAHSFVRLLENASAQPLQALGALGKPCGQHTVPCVNKSCPTLLASFQQRDRHVAVCEFSAPRCPNSGCGMRCLSSEIARHAESCGYRVIACAECTERIRANELSEHSSSICPFRRTACPYCTQSVMLTRLKLHTANCSKRPATPEHSQLASEPPVNAATAVERADSVTCGETTCEIVRESAMQIASPPPMAAMVSRDKKRSVARRTGGGYVGK